MKTNEGRYNGCTQTLAIMTIKFTPDMTAQIWWIGGPRKNVNMDMERGRGRGMIQWQVARLNKHPWISPACGHEDTLNTLRPRQNGHYFAEDTFKCIFFNKNLHNLIWIVLEFCSQGSQMAWHWAGNKALSEPMMAYFIDTYMGHLASIS